VAAVKLKLPPNFQVLTAAEFFATVEPSRDITRIGIRPISCSNPQNHRWCVGVMYAPMFSSFK
jgi:hypothetical protein